MTVPRAIFLLLVFGSLAVTVIELRSAQTRASVHIGRMQRERLDLRTESWALQVDIARLGAPQRIRDLSAHWSLDLHAPHPPSRARVDSEYASGG